MLSRLALIVAVAGSLSACAHSELKAPCDASEGVLSYAEPSPAADCGPMRRLNGPATFDTMRLDAELNGKQAR